MAGVSDREAERRALLVRAACEEAKRQDARGRRDTVAEQAHAQELSRIWQRYAQIGGLTA